MRQPPASWQTDAFVAVVAQTRLQQVEQPGQTSPSIAQLPVVEIPMQVPAVLPDGIEQLPLQHSVPEKQTSPSGWQPAPVVMQVPPWQLCEQQVVPSVQLLPSVVQLPARTAAHMPPAQLPLQHCASPVQAVPSCVQLPAQLPPTHDRPQHCTDEVQVAPLARQPPPMPPEPPPPATTTQLCDGTSQLPTQQSPSRLHMPPGALHELPPTLMSAPLPLLEDE
jgi:hypothetical protein